MRQIGLALSGGGFRASLYHLGVIRLLHDADLLRQVSHITSVSGGSVVGAYLALNWHRYCGSEHEFDAAAKEVTRFIQLDVRNRIVRRYPLAALLNGTRRVFRVGTSRRLTRPGLLESYYEKHLYGDKCLSELPERPQLHILATNVREGSLCSFTRRGMIFQTQSSDNQCFKLVNAGLTTVPMAVAASSAFPGFFPPLELSAEDVGASEGEFPPHSFIDPTRLLRGAKDLSFEPGTFRKSHSGWSTLGSDCQWPVDFRLGCGANVGTNRLGPQVAKVIQQADLECHVQLA